MELSTGKLFSEEELSDLSRFVDETIETLSENFNEEYKMKKNPKYLITMSVYPDEFEGDK